MENNKFYPKNVQLEVHLEGKSSDSILISLDDLQNLVSGINGMSKYLIKKRFGKQPQSKFDKEMKEVCSLGVKNIKEGSAILELQAFPEGQQKLNKEFNVETFMNELVSLINSFEDDPNKFPLEAVPYFDYLTKPLDTNEAQLEINIISDGKITLTSRKLTFISRGKIQTILERKKLKSGVMYGILKELNLKDYSAKTLLFNKKLEKFFFEKEMWETIRDMLESRVEVKFEGKGNNKRLIEINKIRSYQEKRKMTGKDILKSNLFGSMSYRDDLNDSVKYARKLGDEAFK